MARLTRAQTLALQERRTRVAEGYMRGIPQYRLAEAEGVDPSQISRDLAVVRDDWKERRAGGYDGRLDEELARIDRLERIAFEAWLRSCQNAEAEHTETETGRVSRRGEPLPDRVKVTKVVKGQAGDPRFLERIAWCIETRLKLLGALKQDSPAQVAVVTVVNGIDLQVVLGKKPGIPYERGSNGVHVNGTNGHHS